MIGEEGGSLSLFKLLQNPLLLRHVVVGSITILINISFMTQNNTVTK